MWINTFVLVLCLSLSFGAKKHHNDHNNGHHDDQGHGHGHNDHNNNDHGHGKHDHIPNTVQDETRDCPAGFFYAGEVSEVETRGEIWIKGDTSPVYSCYSIQEGNMDWVNASQKCFEQKGQLLSINNNKEEVILQGQMFWQRFFDQDADLDSVELPTGVLSSGISLMEGDWTWFGAAESIDGMITDQMNATDSNDTQCFIVSWNKGPNGTELSYSALPCMDSYTHAVCEVRVYTQTWYVWATTNWLQILFLFTLVLLIVSSCVTVQIYSSRPSHRNQRRSNEMSGTPPAYTPHDVNMTTTTKTANKYAEKGKELLAKVVFYRQPEDKQKLTTNA